MWSKQRKQVVLLYLSTIGGVLLGVLASVINTRFIPTDQYGDVRYVQNIINFIASVLLFGYFLSGSRLLALSSSEEKSRRIRGLMIIILSICSLLLCIALLFCYVVHLKAKPNVASLFLVSLPVCAYPLFSNYISTTAQGDNHIGRLSLSKVLPSLLYIPIAFFIYKEFGASSAKMILLQWGIYSIVFLLIIISTKPSFHLLHGEWQDLKKENKQYGFQLYLGSLVMVATGYIAGITLGIVNPDNSEVGFYTLALTVTAPLQTLPAVIGTTYFKQFATQPRIPQKVMLATLVVTTLSCIAFLFLIKPVVKFLYTDSYSSVGTYARWLSLGYCIHGIGDMINRYLGSHGQGKSIRNSSIMNGVFKLFGYTVLVYFMGTSGAILTSILCSFIYCGALLYYYYQFVKGQEFNE